jgi:hypothetical protein
LQLADFPTSQVICMKPQRGARGPPLPCERLEEGTADRAGGRRDGETYGLDERAARDDRGREGSRERVPGPGRIDDVKAARG